MYIMFLIVLKYKLLKTNFSRSGIDPLSHPDVGERRLTREEKRRRRRASLKYRTAHATRLRLNNDVMFEYCCISKRKRNNNVLVVTANFNTLGQTLLNEYIVKSFRITHKHSDVKYDCEHLDVIFCEYR